MNKLIRNGLVGILVSPEFGAGWSTWDEENTDFLLFDPGLIKLCEKKASEKEVKEYLKKKGIVTSIGGWNDIEVCWLPEGTKFRIDEYDGSECLETIESIKWKTA